MQNGKSEREKAREQISKEYLKRMHQDDATRDDGGRWRKRQSQVRSRTERDKEMARKNKERKKERECESACMG